MMENMKKLENKIIKKKLTEVKRRQKLLMRKVKEVIQAISDDTVFVLSSLAVSLNK